MAAGPPKMKRVLDCVSRAIQGNNLDFSNSTVGRYQPCNALILDLLKEELGGPEGHPQKRHTLSSARVLPHCTSQPPQRGFFPSGFEGAVHILPPSSPYLISLALAP